MRQAAAGCITAWVAAHVTNFPPITGHAARVLYKSSHGEQIAATRSPEVACRSRLDISTCFVVSSCGDILHHCIAPAALLGMAKIYSSSPDLPIPTRRV